MPTTGDGKMNSSDSGTSDGRPNPGTDDHDPPQDQENQEESGHKTTHPQQQEHVVQSQGEPIVATLAEYSGGRGNSRSTPTKPVKGILKNRDMRSPLTDDAFNYSGPTEPDTVRDNNYDEDKNRFSKLVDSRELHARKIKAGLVKKRVRNSSTESAPELTFYPKRQDRNDEGEDGKRDLKGTHSKKPPPTV